MTARYKAGSRVQQVWEVFEASGPEKAYNFGLTLELKANTLRSWMRMFAKNLGQDPKTIALPKGEAAQKANIEVQQVLGRRRVYVDGWPERLGYVVKAGPEVSECKWDDGINMQQYVINEWLVDVKEDKAKTSKRKKAA